MIYRVIIKNGYNEMWLDFDDMSEAGKFAETVLVKQVPNEDNKKKAFVTIRVINPEENKDEEDED